MIIYLKNDTVYLFHLLIFFTILLKRKYFFQNKRDNSRHTMPDLISLMKSTIDLNLFSIITRCFEEKSFSILRSKTPWSMITDNRIFSRNFAVYGRLR
jgi:hypothetical protein